MTLKPKNWTRFQHYKDRRPPWIKLYRTLLDDRAFMCLPTASTALAPMLWLLASDEENGEIQGEMADIAFKLRMTTTELNIALMPLISNGMFEDGSNVLASGLQVAIPETETEGETEGEKPPFIPPLPGGKQKKVSERKARATPLPELWAPREDTHHAMAWEMKLNLFEEMDKFKDFHQSRGNRFVDWDRAFNTWLRNAADYKARTKR
jgi:hypothetical protein